MSAAAEAQALGFGHMTSEEFVLPEACEGLVSRCLFYPSAGTDTAAPLSAFLPWVDDFWFVDVAYNLALPFSSRHELEDARTEELTGTTMKTHAPFRIDIRHERYRWPQRSAPVNIHRCRGRGYDTLRAGFVAPGRTTSVFFHRGDSPGDGGSNFYWLSRKMLPYVLRCLEPGGLVVSDGSNAMRQFAQFHYRHYHNSEIGAEAVGLARPFEAASRRFVCVGYLGKRNGPTLVWKTSEA